MITVLSCDENMPYFIHQNHRLLSNAITMHVRWTVSITIYNHHTLKVHSKFFTPKYIVFQEFKLRNRLKISDGYALTVDVI